VAAQLARARMRTVFGDVSFNSDRQNVVPFLVLQVMPNRKQLVVTAAAAIVPMPPWKKRRCEASDECATMGGCKEDGNCMYTPCPMGSRTVNNTLGRPGCEKCSPGWFSVSGKVEACTPCLAGTLRLWRSGCPRLRPVRARSVLPLLAVTGYFGQGLGGLSAAESKHACAGYFQPDVGQFGCISCDSLGDYYQELQGETFCRRCPANTTRYRGGLDGANRSSCECKEGLHSIRSPSAPSLSLCIHSPASLGATRWRPYGRILQLERGSRRGSHICTDRHDLPLSPSEWMRRPEHSPWFAVGLLAVPAGRTLLWEASSPSTSPRSRH
jgi:hypothetical protein